MSKPRVLIADAVTKECDSILTNRGVEVVRAVGVPEEELLKLLPDFDGMVVRSAVTVKRPMIERMDRMRAIGRAGSGVDNIDVKAATEKGIIVMNVPDGNTISAAEHAVAMMLSMLRKIPAANASMRADKWDRKTFTGTEVLEKRVGVLGLGRIGREVATRIKSFRATVIGYDPILSPDAIRGLGVEPVSLDELIATSDIITIHVPLLPETKGMLGTEQIAKMKKGSFIVNCARGGIVDEAALLAALESGQIAGAALDVYETEPPTLPNPLVSHPNVVATPHIAASTNEAQERVAIAIAHQLADFFEGAGASGVVNAAGLEGSFNREAIPIMDAATTLGAFLGQFVASEDLHCKLTAFGAEATPIVRGLGAAFLAGLISEGIATPVNAINAGMLAEERKIRLETAGEGEHSQYRTLVTATVTDEDGKSHTASATVFGLREPRIVEIDGIWLDVRPEGTLVLFENDDRPGVVAAVSAVLARNQVNIADVALGRREGSGSALTAIRVDGDITPEVAGELSSLDLLHRLRVLKFKE